MQWQGKARGGVEVVLRDHLVINTVRSFAFDLRYNTLAPSSVKKGEVRRINMV